MSTEYPKPTLRPGPPSDAARAIEGERAESCERAARADAAAGVPLLAVYVDDDVYVLNKPAQTYVHDIERLVARGMVKCDDATTVDNRATTRDVPFNASESARVVHRLDRDTSGCLVVARNRDAIRSLSAQFADGTVQKTYVALCAATADYDGVEDHRRVFTGWGRAKYGLFRLYDAADIGRALPGNKKVKVKHAETTIIVERVITDGVALRFCEPPSADDADRRRHRVALARCSPLTGRTHQIRLHCASLGLPLVGDVRYGGPIDATRDGPIDAPFSARRVAGALLHAERVAFRHPKSNLRVDVHAPRPPWARLYGAL